MNIPPELLIAGVIALAVLLLALIIFLVASAATIVVWFSLARSDSKYADMNDVIIDPHALVTKKERQKDKNL